MNAHVTPERSPTYAENEISSRWGRALFTVVFDGGLSAVGALAGFKIAEVVSESGAAEAAAATGGLVAGFVSAAMLKRIGRRQ